MFWVCCRRITNFCRVITWFCLLITIFFELLRFFYPTFPRNSSDTHKPLSACRPAFSLDPAGNGWGSNWVRRYERVNG